MKLESTTKCKAGSIDPVHDETELELATNNDSDKNLPGLRVESEAREGY